MFMSCHNSDHYIIDADEYKITYNSKKNDETLFYLDLSQIPEKTASFYHITDIDIETNKNRACLQSQIIPD